MAKSDKVAAVAELVERFRAADAVLLTEYRGLTVGQLKQLRRGLGENATYAVQRTRWRAWLPRRSVSTSSLRTSRVPRPSLSSPASPLRPPRPCVILLRTTPPSC